MRNNEVEIKWEKKMFLLYGTLISLMKGTVVSGVFCLTASCLLRGTERISMQTDYLIILCKKQFKDDFIKY